MVTKLVKKNKFVQELFTKKYKPRVIKPKKGKGSFKRKKKKLIIKLPFLCFLNNCFYLKSCSNLLNNFR